MAKLRDLSDSLICMPGSLELVPFLAFWPHQQEMCFSSHITTLWKRWKILCGWQQI